MSFNNFTSFILPRYNVVQDNYVRRANNRTDFDRTFDVNFWHPFSRITSFDNKVEIRTARTFNENEAFCVL